MKRLALPLLLAAFTAAAAEPRLPELRLAYAVTWNDIRLGTATITLKPEGGKDCYRYESVSDPVGLVRMFYGRPRETSDFCIAGGKVMPKRFSYVNPKSNDESFTLEFSSDARRVTHSRGEVRELPPNAQDRFAIQQAVRLWVLAGLKKDDPGKVEFAMVDDKKTRVYQFAITGREPVQVPAGTFESLLVQRVDNPKRMNKYWIAPDRDYMPVRVETQRNGEAQLLMELLPEKK